MLNDVIRTCKTINTTLDYVRIHHKHMMDVTDRQGMLTFLRHMILPLSFRDPCCSVLVFFLALYIFKVVGRFLIVIFHVEV